MSPITKIAAAPLILLIAILSIVWATGGESGGGNGASPAPAGRITQLETTGEMHTMLQQHQAMMEQMRVSTTPQMTKIMEQDPMWQMLHSGQMIELMEQHQAEIDEMLARR